MTGSVSCPNGHVSAPEDRFCPRCGAVIARQVPAIPEPPPAKSGDPAHRRTILTVVAVVLGLVGITGAALAAKAVSGDDADAQIAKTYPTADALKEAAVLAGAECRDYIPASEALAGAVFPSAKEVAECGHGGPATYLLAVFDDAAAVHDYVHRPISVPTWFLTGPNWAINDSKSALNQFAGGLGGRLVKNAGTASHDEPETSGPPVPETSPSDQIDTTDAPPGQAATPNSRDTGVDCTDMNEVQCQEATAIADVCPADASTVVLNSSPAPGLSKFSYVETAGIDGYDALASGEYRTGAFVESCGNPTNGIDVVAMHRAIAQQSEVWLDEIAAVTCHAKKQGIDEAPVGASFNCDVWDKSGFPNQAKVTVTGHDPHYRIQVLFGD